jgi:hypothetical protein
MGERAGDPVLVPPPRGAERAVSPMDDPPIAGEEPPRGVGDDLSGGQDAVLEGQIISSLVALSLMSG